MAQLKRVLSIEQEVELSPADEEHIGGIVSQPTDIEGTAYPVTVDAEGKATVTVPESSSGESYQSDQSYVSTQSGTYAFDEATRYSIINAMMEGKSFWVSFRSSMFGFYTLRFPTSFELSSNHEVIFNVGSNVNATFISFIGGTDKYTEDEIIESLNNMVGLSV